MTAFTRRALTDSDAPAFVALSAAIFDADGGGHRADEGDFRRFLHHPLAAPGFEDFQGVFDGDRLAATARVARRELAEPVHWMAAEGGVHPDYRGRGIGTGLLRRQEELASRIHEHYFAGHPLELSVRVTEHNEGARELFANEGYQPIRWSFEMRRPADTPVQETEPPVGLELETYTATACEELRTAFNEAFRDHWRALPMSAADWEHWINQEKVRHDLSFLLRDAANGEIAGFVVASLSVPELKATGVRDLHLNLVGTRREYRGRGVAAVLIAHAVRQSRELGLETVTLNVDAENPTGALGVYQRAGFECERKELHYAKDLMP